MTEILPISKLHSFATIQSFPRSTGYQDVVSGHRETTTSKKNSSNDDDGKITITIFQISLITLSWKAIFMVHLPTVVLGLYGIFCSLGYSKYTPR